MKTYSYDRYIHTVLNAEGHKQGIDQQASYDAWIEWAQSGDLSEDDALERAANGDGPNPVSTTPDGRCPGCHQETLWHDDEVSPGRDIDSLECETCHEVVRVDGWGCGGSYDPECGHFVGCLIHLEDGSHLIDDGNGKRWRREESVVGDGSRWWSPVTP